MTDDAPQVRGELVQAYVELADPVEGELRREPIADADAPCPRCGAREWLLVERRAEPEFPFTRWRALACASCGAAGGWQSAGRARPGRAAEMRGGPRPERFPGMPEQPTVDDVCRVASFRVVAASSSPRLRSVAYRDDTLFGVSLESGDVEVTMEIRWSVVDPAAPAEFEPTPEERAREELEELVCDENADRREPRSEPARALDDAAAHRRADARAAAAPVRELIIELDGEALRFACVQHDACWAAAAQVDDLMITVATRAAPAGAVTLQTRD